MIGYKKILIPLQIVFSLLLAYAMAVPAPEPTPEAAPEAEADPAVLASYSKAPLVVPAYYHVPYYYGYHLIGKRSAEPQPMDQFAGRYSKHMPSPYMPRFRHV